MIDLKIEIECPKCSESSTVKEWDKHTAQTYGYDPCLIQNDEYIDEHWFICPKCNCEIDGEDILDILKNK